MTRAQLQDEIDTSGWDPVFRKYGFIPSLNGWVNKEALQHGVAKPLSNDDVINAILKANPEFERKIKVSFEPPEPPKGFNFPHPMKKINNSDISILAFGYEEKAMILSVDEDSDYKPGDMIMVDIDNYEPIFEKVTITFNG